MTSEPSAVQRRDFRHTAATTLSWHSGSTTRATGSRSHSRRTGSSMRRATVLFRTEGSAGNVLAIGLWRAEDGTTPIHTSDAGNDTFLVLRGG